MRLAFATQAVDPADPVLGATVPKLHALAARVDELVVLADRVDRAALPANARAYAFGARSKSSHYPARNWLSAAPPAFPVSLAVHDECVSSLPMTVLGRAVEPGSFRLCFPNGVAVAPRQS